MKALKKIGKLAARDLTRLLEKGYLHYVDEADLRPLVEKGRLICREYPLDFYAGSPARTIYPSDLGSDEHGWTVVGAVSEDYYEWVNEFTATHTSGQVVFGDFQDRVYASSTEALEEFLRHHPFKEWDYFDI